jgi:hypothetical protein
MIGCKSAAIGAAAVRRWSEDLGEWIRRIRRGSMSRGCTLGRRVASYTTRDAKEIATLPAMPP